MEFRNVLLESGQGAVGLVDVLTQADRVERRERRRVGDVGKVPHQGKELPDAFTVHERKQIPEGWPYSKAHIESSRLEFRCRHHPDELDDALTTEGLA